jgi:hypothetical protein
MRIAIKFTTQNCYKTRSNEKFILKNSATICGRENEEMYFCTTETHLCCTLLGSCGAEGKEQQKKGETQ